jgi:hypothetical protein
MTGTPNESSQAAEAGENGPQGPNAMCLGEVLFVGLSMA